MNLFDENYNNQRKNFENFVYESLFKILEDYKKTNFQNRWDNNKLEFLEDYYYEYIEFETDRFLSGNRRLNEIVDNDYRLLSAVKIEKGQDEVEEYIRFRHENDLDTDINCFVNKDNDLWVFHFGLENVEDFLKSNNIDFDVPPSMKM